VNRQGLAIVSSGEGSIISDRFVSLTGIDGG
jgi:hypothetical protein